MEDISYPAGLQGRFPYKYPFFQGKNPMPVHHGRHFPLCRCCKMEGIFCNGTVPHCILEIAGESFRYGIEGVYAAVCSHKDGSVRQLGHFPYDVVGNGVGIVYGGEEQAYMLTVITVEAVPGSKPHPSGAVLEHCVYRGIG